MPEVRIASVTVPAKRPFNTTESGVDESGPLKAKPQKKYEEGISSFIQKRVASGPLVIRNEGTITRFLSLLVL